MSLRDWPIKQKLTAMLVVISGLVLLLTSAGFAGYRFEGGLWIGFRPVQEAGSQRLGTWYLASGLEVVYDTFRLSGVIGLAVMAVALLAAYLLSMVLQGTISQPILALAETAKAVSTRQDYSVRASKLGEDELGALTDAFNQMLGRIEAQKNELQRYARELEQRA